MRLAATLHAPLRNQEVTQFNAFPWNQAFPDKSLTYPALQRLKCQVRLRRKHLMPTFPEAVCQALAAEVLVT